MNINTILKKLKLNPIERQEGSVATWEEWFKGDVTTFHKYTEYMGDSQVKRHRKSSKMAKTISEQWADNIINPETEIVISSDKETNENQEWWDNINERLGIIYNLNDLMEVTFALGNGATIQSKNKDGNVFQQYLNMNYIYPLRVDLGEIVDCAFASKQGEYIYIQIHLKQEDGTYEITNKLFDEEGKELELVGIEEKVPSDVKLFQLYSPAIVNNINLGSPLGISIYANAIDELESVDIAYDALDKEIRNGRMRIFIQSELMYVDKGKEKMVFNKDQDEFYLLPEDDTADNKFTVVSPDLRIESLINNLEKQMNLLGTKCGLGDNSFYSKDGTIYTNTEQVVSSNSKFYKTRQKHVTRIEKSLVDMVKALYYLEHDKKLEDPIHVNFDDSIIHDKEAETNNARLEYANGLISAVEYFKITRGLTDKEALNYYNEQIANMNLDSDVEEEGGEI